MTAEVGDRLVQARPGIPVAKALAAGDVDLGFQQLSELVAQPGVRILGVLPEDCAIVTVFAGAVATASTDPTRAAQVLKFLASARAALIKAAHSFGGSFALTSSSCSPGTPVGRSERPHVQIADFSRHPGSEPTSVPRALPRAITPR